ncbi:acyl-CoA dehydrogenase family protein [Streptomyces sp. NPDC020667]|uniref:acyl-CoA dehydrogenase family protein n=1 Tax=Streptomyces sp. NPDC020667 TaxID=3154895 RepID=UPI0033D2CDB3
MDFRLTGDQRALQAGMRALLAARYPHEKLRAAVDASEGPAEDVTVGAVVDAVVDAPAVLGGAPEAQEAAGGPGARKAAESPVDRELWAALGDAGFFALRLPEEDGGTGLGLPEAVLLFEEAGRALLPGPLVATHLAAGLAPGAADGTRIVTALDGPGVAEHLASADAVLLLTGDTARLLPVDAGAGPRALRAAPFRSVDPLTPLHRVRDLPSAACAGGLAPEADAARLRREAALLTAAQQLGSARATLALAVSHARHRVQFGRPVGSFQAVQHLCAQMLVRTDLARASVYAASVTEDPAETAGAKLLADSAAIRNARDCLQVHGGLGFTWEADIHLHLKRAWVRAFQWQSTEESEEFLANELLMDAADENAPDVWWGTLGGENVQS